MFNFKEYGIHIVTFVFIISTPIYVIPNLSIKPENYDKGEGVLINARIDTSISSGRYFQKRIQKALVRLLFDMFRKVCRTTDETDLNPFLSMVPDALRNIWNSIRMAT